jgi:hypothetical protein
VLVAAADVFADHVRRCRGRAGRIRGDCSTRALVFARLLAACKDGVGAG